MCLCRNGVPCHAGRYVQGMTPAYENQALQAFSTVTDCDDDCYITCTLFTKRDQLSFFDFPLSLNISSCGESPAGTTLTLNYTTMTLHVIFEQNACNSDTCISHKKLAYTVHIKDNRY